MMIPYIILGVVIGATVASSIFYDLVRKDLHNGFITLRRRVYRVVEITEKSSNGNV